MIYTAFPALTSRASGGNITIIIQVDRGKLMKNSLMDDIIASINATLIHRCSMILLFYCTLHGTVRTIVLIVTWNDIVFHTDFYISNP